MCVCKFSFFLSLSTVYERLKKENEMKSNLLAKKVDFQFGVLCVWRGDDVCRLERKTSKDLKD